MFDDCFGETPKPAREVRAGLALRALPKLPLPKLPLHCAREWRVLEISNIWTAFRAIATKNREPFCFTSNPPVSRDEAKRFAAALILLFCEEVFSRPTSVAALYEAPNSRLSAAIDRRYSITHTNEADRSNILASGLRVL